MNAKNTVTRTQNSRRRGKTDWARVEALSDRKIEQAIRSDPDVAPSSTANGSRKQPW